MASNKVEGSAHGAGFYSGAVSGGEPTIKNTIVGDNLGATDVSGRVQSQDYNLIEDPLGFTLSGLTDHNIIGEDPRLDDLADNGGQTETHALESDSPAVDGGSCTDVWGDPVTVDQRGVGRPQGPECDIGAYELYHHGPSIGTFGQHGGSGQVGDWVDFTVTYTGPSGYQDIVLAFFFLDRAPPIASGGLAVAYYQPGDLLVLLGGGSCQPGQAETLDSGTVVLDCGASSAAGAGDTLTLALAVQPSQCFVGGCGWNYAVGAVTDSAGQSDAGLMGWWSLTGTTGPAGTEATKARPTRADLRRLRKGLEAWRSTLHD